jgi:hypothetical protein
VRIFLVGFCGNGDCGVMDNDKTKLDDDTNKIDNNNNNNNPKRMIDDNVNETMRLLNTVAVMLLIMSCVKDSLLGSELLTKW